MAVVVVVEVVVVVVVVVVVSPPSPPLAPSEDIFPDFLFWEICAFIFYSFW